MADVFSTEERSRIMGRVRSSGNKSTELRLIAIMRKAGITGWRRGSQLPGRPDFVFRQSRVAVFVDGCFWHGCPRCGSMPATRVEYWMRKIGRNRARDQAVGRQLRALGWRVVRIWECALREADARRRAASSGARETAVSAAAGKETVRSLPKNVIAQSLQKNRKPALMKSPARAFNALGERDSGSWNGRRFSQRRQNWSKKKSRRNVYSF